MSYSTSPRLDVNLPQRRTLFRGVRPAVVPPVPFRPLARILVSDDDPDIRRIYAVLLNAHGFEYLGAPAGDGLATLELARRIRPHLVITDLNKPGLGGNALREALQAEPATAQIPILTISAMDPWSGRRAQPITPLEDYLLKPFTTEALLYRVAALLPLGPADHDRLVERARQLPCFEHVHPVTGLPCLHTLAGSLPNLTATPDWAALSIELADFPRLVRALGRPAAEGLLARLGGVARAAAESLFTAHPGFDPRIAIVGPAPAVAQAEARLIAGFAALSAYGTRLGHGVTPRLHLRRADHRSGTVLTLPALRAALRG